MNNGTGVLSLGIIWFGAAVSVAEIEAGIQFGNNWKALVLGHVLGGLMLFAVGLIGATYRRNAMESAEECFGKRSSKFFSVLNVFQLVGWTSVMIAQAADALSGLDVAIPIPAVCGILALFIALWIFVGLGNSCRLAFAGIAPLALLMILLTYKLFYQMDGFLPIFSESRSFSESFELSIAMPLSWLPLISDYTKKARNPVLGAGVSATVYTLTSIWMYAIGMGIAAASACGVIPEASLSGVVSGLGVGLAGILIIVFSTVTTTFLDAFSAGESAKTIFGRLNSKIAGVATCALGAVLAITGTIEHYTEFLYLIASVFAPMASVMVVFHYLVRRFLKLESNSARYICAWNGISWLAGFSVYQIVVNSPIGASLAAMLVSGSLAACGLSFKKLYSSSWQKLFKLPQKISRPK